MAQTTELTRRIDGELDAVAEMLSELPEVAAEWETLPESEQAAWPLDWDQAMAFLRLLDQSYRASHMTPAQQARYRGLLKQLGAALPMLEQLCLQRPPVSLDL